MTTEMVLYCDPVPLEGVEKEARKHLPSLLYNGSRATTAAAMFAVCWIRR